jgi:hypothetical protein
MITYLWYPEFLFKTDGGWNGIRLIAGIDFIIGPTLTLIVYKAGKTRSCPYWPYTIFLPGFWTLDGISGKTYYNYIFKR